MPKSKFSSATSLLLVILLFLFFWPILIPVAIGQHLLIERKKLQCAKTTRCQACDGLLGNGSIERADRFWSEHMKSFQQEFPGARLRVVRTIHAICACEQKYSYDEKHNCFVMVAASN